MDLGHKKGWNPQWDTNYRYKKNRLANLVAYMLRHPNQGILKMSWIIVFVIHD
jgi:hypothetical protein